MLYSLPSPCQALFLLGSPGDHGGPRTRWWRRRWIVNVCFNLYSLSVCCYHHNVENKNSIRFNAIQWDICLKNHWSWESMLIFTMILVWNGSKTYLMRWGAIIFHPIWAFFLIEICRKTLILGPRWFTKSNGYAPFKS